MRAFIKSLYPEPEESQRAFGAFEAGVLVTTCLGLMFIQFVGGELSFRTLFGDWLLDGAVFPSQYERVQAMKAHEWYGLMKLGHWSICCLIGYMVFPLIYMKFSGRSLASLHFSLKGTWAHRGTYFRLALIMLPPVFYVASWEDYQHIYPFYDQAGRSLTDLVLWECFYLSQFLALEFFFRGFMLSQLRPWAGHGAIFIMVIPYCMIHFPKTGSETLGAIIAGIVLGALAMRGRSIWGGVFLHCGIALTMDLLCLYHAGTLTRLF